MSRRSAERLSAFDDANPTLEEVADEIYGQPGHSDLDATRASIRSLDIMAIWPDLRQPRRAIPHVVRGAWDGDPANIPALLEQWHYLAERQHGHRLPLPVNFVMAHGEGLEVDPDRHPLLAEWLDLLSLAASILRDGLANPITVVRRADGYRIETGERRWLAFHLLKTYADSQRYAAIPAQVGSRANVWKQAAENGARRPLNAIGVARQLALLIMDMYEGDAGVRFDAYEDIVLPGECDRRFYAQVANGGIYRIKRGMGQRVLDVTGLKSAGQLHHYRNLLSIPDELWMRADAENWTEGGIRNALNPAPQNTIKMPYTSTIVDVSPQNRPESPQNAPFQTLERSVPAARDTDEFTPVAAPEFEDEDERIAAQENAWFDRQERGQQESKTPLIRQRPALHAFLANLLQIAQALGDQQTQAALSGLLQASPEDIRQYIQVSGARDFSERIQDSEALAADLVITTILSDLRQFAEDLCQIAFKLERKNHE